MKKHSISPAQLYPCYICKNTFPKSGLTPLSLVRDSLLPCMKIEASMIHGNFVCNKDLNQARKAYFSNLLTEEKRELSELEKDLLEALHENDIISLSPSKIELQQTSFGQRLADSVAKMGGSWGFIIGFLICLAGWIFWNLFYKSSIDPFPFIFLNLILSCIAAIQAPVIMMSQNRAAAYDRLRAEQDYKINIKSEIEIRVLNEKVDRLIAHQWQRLLEIQEIQLDLLNQIESN